jgi:hypothetical protein
MWRRERQGDRRGQHLLVHDRDFLVKHRRVLHLRDFRHEHVIDDEHVDLHHIGIFIIDKLDKWWLGGMRLRQARLYVRRELHLRAVRTDPMKIKIVTIDFEIPRRKKRIMILVGLPLGLLLGAAAIVHANVPNTFAPGDTLSAQKMNANFASLDARVTTLESGGVVWKDATGTVATGVIGPPPNPYYVDASGRFWHVNPDTLAVTLGSTTLFGTFPAYQTADCTGAEYFIAGGVPATFPLPRMTFNGPGDPPATVRVRPDTEQVQMITRCSVLNGTTCMPVSPCDGPYSALQAAATLPATPIAIPTLALAPPLHPELP